MRYISVECEYFSAKFVPNPALLTELFLSEAMSIHSGGVDEQGKGQAPDDLSFLRTNLFFLLSGWLKRSFRRSFSLKLLLKLNTSPVA